MSAPQYLVPCFCRRDEVLIAGLSSEIKRRISLRDWRLGKKCRSFINMGLIRALSHTCTYTTHSKERKEGCYCSYLTYPVKLATEHWIVKKIKVERTRRGTRVICAICVVMYMYIYTYTLLICFWVMHKYLRRALRHN